MATKRDNAIRLMLTNELKNDIDSIRGNVSEPFTVILAYLKTHEQRLRAKWGDEIYEKHVKSYSRTTTELRDARLQKQKEKLEHDNLELELRKKELAVKLQNAENFEIQTQGSNTTFPTAQELKNQEIERERTNDIERVQRNSDLTEEEKQQRIKNINLLYDKKLGKV